MLLRGRRRAGSSVDERFTITDYAICSSSYHITSAILVARFQIIADQCANDKRVHSIYRRIGKEMLPVGSTAQTLVFNERDSDRRTNIHVAKRGSQSFDDIQQTKEAKGEHRDRDR